MTTLFETVEELDSLLSEILMAETSIDRQDHNNVDLVSSLSGFSDRVQVAAMALFRKQQSSIDATRTELLMYKYWFLNDLAVTTAKIAEKMKQAFPLVSLNLTSLDIESISYLLTTGDIELIYQFYAQLFSGSAIGGQVANQITGLLVSVRGTEPLEVAADTQQVAGDIADITVANSVPDRGQDNSFSMYETGTLTTHLQTISGERALENNFLSSLETLNTIYYDIFSTEWGESGINPRQFIDTATHCAAGDSISILSADHDDDLVPIGAAVVADLDETQIIHSINSLLEDTTSETGTRVEITTGELPRTSAGRYVYFAEIFIDSKYRAKIGRRPFVELVNRPVRAQLAKGLTPDTPVVFFTKGPTSGSSMPTVYYFAKLLRMKEISSPSMIANNRHAYTIPLGYLNFVSTYPFPALPILGFSTLRKKLGRKLAKIMHKTNHES